MIRVDDRVGSIELLPKLREYGVKAVKERLQYGDFAWLGNGPLGRSNIAIERKRIHDLIDSIVSKRLSGHQLPGMAAEYDYVYLLIEGLWRPGSSGELETRNGKWSAEHSSGLSYRAVNSFLNTLEVKAGVIVKRTWADVESAEVIVDLYRWWQEPWDKHQSHSAVYAPADSMNGRRFSLNPRRITQLEKVAMQFPGLDSRAQFIAEHFKTVTEFVSAGEGELAEVKCRVGRGKKSKWQRLGTAAARKIKEAMEGRE